MVNGTTDNTKNPVSDLCVAEDPAQEMKLLNRQQLNAALALVKREIINLINQCST